MIKELKEWLIDLVAGLSISGALTLVIPELIHLFFVIASGVIGTICIHYTRKYLNE